MEIENKIIKEKVFYNNLEIIDDIAIVKLDNGYVALYNIKSKQLIIEKGKYDIINDKNNKFIYLISKDKNSEENNTINIYDVKNKSMFIKNYELIEKHNIFSSYFDNMELLILKNTNTNKYHIFNCYTARNKNDIINEGFEKVEYIEGMSNKSFIVTKQKKGIIKINVENKLLEIEEPLEFDNIENDYGLLIFTKDKQQYAKKEVDGKIKETEKYNKIEKIEGFLLKCKNNKTIEILYSRTLRKIISSEEYDDINLLYKKEIGYRKYDHYFDVVKNNKHGIIKVTINYWDNKENMPKIVKIVKINYDKIKIKDENFVLINNNKLGLSIGLNYNDNPIEPRYDSIEQIGIYSIILNNNGISTICTMEYENNQWKITPLIENCNIIDHNTYFNSYTFKKDNKVGLFYPSKYFEEDNILLPAKYDSIEKLINDININKKKNLLGLAQKDKIILPIKYNEIKIGFDSKQNIYNYLFLALKEKNYYKIACQNNYKSEIKMINDNNYTKIDFLDDIFICKNENETEIYNYIGQLILRLPNEYEIEYQTEINKKINKPIYKINNKYYYYENGKLIEPYIDTNYLYIAEYKTNDNNSYNLSTNNLEEYNQFKKDINNLIVTEGENAVEKQLRKYSENSILLNAIYPTIKIKKKSIKK